ncbi:YcaO-like family protein [Ruegeria aquimaris]|uniref:YcaO-like family protein n=1 Tax=Ruegeria aquimaris TaxID=2984333 RepID=A0ABT3ARC4_9RHOB|nr:YcaO-like family protein [Ruegeria sp. XHP0148]MCV2891229.1 YcaO-like family protein [Ruegeria sp. XHP0148]
MPTARNVSFVKKCFLSGTHRTVDPTATWARIKPLFPDIGITRVADVTGLDCIGIPVCNAIRPNARSLSVSQGKGVGLPQARVSAAMEAIELFHAERTRGDVVRASFTHLGHGNATDPRDLSLLRSETQGLPNTPIHWVQGHDLISGRPVRVPRDLVSCDLRHDAPTDGIFLTSSNGLGAGNTREEAILHALCEVVERDATCLHQAASARFGGEPALVDPDTIDDPLCLWLMERITQAEIDLHVWVQFSDLQVSSFGCAISDRHGGKFPGAPIGTFQGYGCHPDRGIALSRAITEAVQSRLTYIAGARDDLFRDDYASIQTARNRRGWLSWLESKGPMMNFRRVPSWASDAVSFDLEAMLDMLVRHGFDQVAWVDLTLDRIGIPVVKVVVPGLVEPTIGNEVPRGKRVDRFLERLNLFTTGTNGKPRMGDPA